MMVFVELSNLVEAMWLKLTTGTLPQPLLITQQPLSTRLPTKWLSSWEEDMCPGWMKALRETMYSLFNPFHTDDICFHHMMLFSEFL